MENNNLSVIESPIKDWYSEEFIYSRVIKFLKENGYKIHKDSIAKETEKTERVITASKYFKKEIIEVKGYPNYANSHQVIPYKSTHAKSWFMEALFNSFVNFSSFENAEVAMALPNVGRYQAIIKKLYDYFTLNNLYFRIYLVNEDGTVEVSNLNQTYLKASAQ